ncbi:hypothetical protein C7212DRAFT_316900, partial [Tuber magnatum]
TPKRPLNSQNLTPGSRPMPPRIPGSYMKVTPLVAYFNRKLRERAAPVTSASRHHDWRLAKIPRDRVRSLVLKFSLMG